MTIWIVLGCVALVLVLVALAPVCAKADYTPKGLVLTLSLGFLSISVYPRPEKKRKKKGKKQPKKAQPPKEEKNAPKPARTLGNWKQFRQYLPLICQAAGELRRKMVVRHLNIHLVWAGENPAAAAIGYGAIHGVIGGIWNLVDGSFREKDHKFVVDLDYDKKEPQIAAKAVVSLRVGQAVSFGIRYSMKLAAMQRNKRENTRHSKEVIHHE